MLSVTNNVLSLVAQDNLNNTSNALATSLQRLSSGLKINSGADGPAALVISQEQNAQIAGLQTAISNTNQAVSVVQTAEGALSEINNLLVQVRGLALSSANAGVNDSTSLAANQAQLQNALDTINSIATRTQFGTRNLLDGSSGITGTATNPNVSFLNASSVASAGTYAVNVTQAAQRAYVTAGTQQTGSLANAETLNINGVNVSLLAGSTQAQVQARINQFTGQTGAVAEDYQTSATSGNAQYQAATYTSGTFSNGGAISGTSLLAGVTSIGGSGAPGLVDGDSLTITTQRADGTAGTSTPLTYTAASTNLNALATAIQTSLGTHYTVSFNGTTGQFDITGDSTVNVANNQLRVQVTDNTTPAANTALQDGFGTLASLGSNAAVAGGAATSSSTLASLTSTTGSYTAGDTLLIQGTKTDGSVVNASLALSAGTTIGNVVTALQNAFGSGYQASFNATTGQFVVQATGSSINGADQVGVSVTNAHGNVEQVNFGAFAGSGDTTRLRTVQYGSAASLSVTSNVAASGTSTGFGTATQTANGVDVAGTIGGYAATGQGNVLTGSASGGANGITIAVTGSASSLSQITSANALSTGTGTATASTLLNSLVQSGNPYGLSPAPTTAYTQTGDTITISGTKTDGTTASGSLTVTANTTVGDLINAINTAFNSNATASFQNGKISLTAATPGSSPLSLTLTNSTSATRNYNFAADPLLGNEDQTQTVTGSLGSINVQNNSLVFQIGANANQTASIAVDNVQTTALGLNVSGNQFANLSQINIESSSGANDAIGIIDASINQVSSLDGNLGAFQAQTLQSTATNLQTALQNTTSAESTIADTDFAAETANYTKDQILLQAGTSVLASANQVSSYVLTLLQKL